MTDFYIDPDGLTAVAEVAGRQRDHLADVSSYISSTCSQFGAFSGVLNIFEGSYRSAVDSALQGMSDGQAVATKVQVTVKKIGEEFIERDHDAYDRFKVLMGAGAALPPYSPPGSGNSTPGGPLADAPAPGEDPEDGDPFKLDKLPPYVGGPAGRVLPGVEGGDIPAALDPKNALKNHVVDSVHQQQLEDRYLQYRHDHPNSTPAEAADAARDSLRDPGAIARDHADDVSRDRTSSAADDAYDNAIANGKSPSEAREASADAAQSQHHTDSVDRGRRDDIADAGGTGLDAYNTASDTVANVESIIDHVQQLEETNDDIDDYEDYENGGSR